MATIQIRIDDETKERADRLFKSLGTDINSAVKIFLAASLSHRGFPFEIKVPEPFPYQGKSEEELLEMLSLARGSAEEGRVEDAKQASSRIRRKYGL